MLTDIDALVQAVKTKLADYLQDQGVDPSKKFLCLNPNHHDSSPSMNMHRDGLFVKCFSCDANYSIFDVASILEGKPTSGPEWVTDNVMYLADKFGLKHNIVQKSMHAKTAEKYAYYKAYAIVADLLAKTAENNSSESFEKEIRKRKWKKKESIELGIGCVNSFKEVLDALEGNGFSKEFIDYVGLMRPDIFNADGVIFTVYDEFNKPIAFYMRDVKYEEKKAAHDKGDYRAEVSRPRTPSKYNSTANLIGIYEKPLFPYGLNDVKNFHKVIVVEGHGCKHSLRLNGIDNVIALGGLELGEQTLNKLKSLGVTNIVLLLDSDSSGREKIKNIIRRYYGKMSVDLSVIDMVEWPDVKDPDEFIRKYGIGIFKQLQERNALEWLTAVEITEKGDPYTVLQDITPLIAIDRSPINRQKIINMIADMTNISRDIIAEEVDQKIAASKDRKSEFAVKVMDEAREMVMMNPGALDAAIHMIETKLSNLNKGNNDDEIFSSVECLKGLVKLQDREESDLEEPVIHTGYGDWDKLMPLPTNEAFILVMGPPNTGKSSMFINMCLRILELNPNAMVIIHTIDDSREVYINRMISVLSKIKINWIKNPKFYLDKEKAKLRSDAYKKVSEYIREERLIIKDIVHGGTVEYHGRLCAHYREKYPTRHMVAMCDNLHRLDSEAGFEDGRFKTKAISGLMKSYTTKYDMVEFCTVEMTKQGMYEKPTNAGSIAEAASLQFDANVIIYLWNEMNVMRDEADLTFESTIQDYLPEAGYIHKPVIKPIIEALFLKNKLSEFKGSMYFPFHPELAIYGEMSIEEAHRIIHEKRAAKQARKEGR